MIASLSLGEARRVLGEIASLSPSLERLVQESLEAVIIERATTPAGEQSSSKSTDEHANPEPQVKAQNAAAAPPRAPQTSPPPAEKKPAVAEAHGAQNKPPSPVPPQQQPPARQQQKQQPQKKSPPPPPPPPAAPKTEAPPPPPPPPQATSAQANREEPPSSGGAGEGAAAILGKDKLWDEMTAEEQVAAAQIGYTRDLWDAGEQTAATTNPWNELSSFEHSAALLLGYTEALWDAELEEADEEGEEEEEEGVREGDEAHGVPAPPPAAPAPARAGEARLLASRQSRRVAARSRHGWCASEGGGGRRVAFGGWLWDEMTPEGRTRRSSLDTSVRVGTAARCRTRAHTLDPSLDHRAERRHAPRVH